MSDDEDDLDQFVRHALVIEAEEARRAGVVGFIARALTQATMPHKAPSDNEFTRQNGHFTLTMMSPRHVGLPYGSIPRLLLSYAACFMDRWLGEMYIDDLGRPYYLYKGKIVKRISMVHKHCALQWEH